MSVKDYLDKEYNYGEFMDKIIRLDPSASDFKKQVQQYSEEYAKYLNEHINDKPLTDVVCLMDLLNNSNPIVATILLREQNDLACRASLVLQRINGIDVHNIKNHINEAIEVVKGNIKENGLGDARNYATILYAELGLKMLNCYLSDIDIEKAEGQIDKDINEFAMNLDKVDRYMFSTPFSRKETYPYREKIINSIFLDPHIDVETLQHIYDEVMLKNPIFKSFNYTELLVNENDGINQRNDILNTIKGIYAQLDNNYYYFLSTCELDDESERNTDVFLRKIIELNKDDEEGLKWFFRQTARYASPSLLEYLKKQDYFNEYYDEKDDTILQRAYDKLLNGETVTNRVILEELGKEECFVNNYELFLDKYIKSNNNDYKESLFIPLISGLIEKQKERYGIDAETRFTSNEIDSHNLGYYDKLTNEIHINPGYFDRIENKDAALVSACDTVFHETRHAYQRKILQTDHSFSFEHLVMAMDNILGDTTGSPYYYDNYLQISIERDADDYAYVDTMTLFDNYPEMKNYRTKMITNDSPLVDYVRRVNYIDVERYYGIIDTFVCGVNEIFEYFEPMEGLCERYAEHIRQFPVVEKFFDIDEEEFRIKPKSEEYFDNKLKEFEAMSDSLEKKEGIYSVNAFRYALKVNEYLRENSKDVKSYGKDVNDEFMKEVVYSVGSKPIR